MITDGCHLPLPKQRKNGLMASRAIDWRLQLERDAML